MLPVLDSCHQLKSVTDFRLEREDEQRMNQIRGKEIEQCLSLKESGEKKLGWVQRD